MLPLPVPPRPPDAAPPDQRTTRSHVPGLDGVRGLAILITVLHNAGSILTTGHDVPWAVKLAYSITWTGWIGVQLFFVLSGFLITGILLDQRGSPHYFRSFYLRRVLRIFPLYYLALAIAFLVVPRFLGSAEYSRLVEDEQLWYWVYLSNWMGALGHRIPVFNHFWSLAVEEQFYLAWPLVVLAAGGRRLARVCLLLLLTAVAFRLAIPLAGLPLGWAYGSTVARCDSLAAGALLALLVGQAGPAGRLRAWVGRIALASVILIGAIAIRLKGFPENAPLVLIVGQSLLIGPCLWLILTAPRPPESPPTGLQRVLESRAARRLGRISYAAYVIHWPLHALVVDRFAPWVNQGGALTRLSHQAAYVSGIFVVTVALSILSWELLEKRVLGLKDRIAPLQPRWASQHG